MSKFEKIFAKHLNFKTLGKSFTNVNEKVVIVFSTVVFQYFQSLRTQIVLFSTFKNFCNVHAFLRNSLTQLVSVI